MPPPINYTYKNPAENLRGLLQPGDDDLDLIGEDTSKPGLSTRERAYAAWNRYRNRKEAEAKEYQERPSGKKPSAALPWGK